MRLLFLGAYNATLIAIGYFRRSHGLSDTDADATVFLTTAIVGASTALAALPGGRLSDRLGRRPVIWGAAAIAGIGLSGVALAPSPAVAVAAWIPFGIGMGVFLSADWALMADVIPKHTAGRYMGILNAGTAMAGPVFIIVAGPVQDLVSGGVRRWHRTTRSDGGRGRLRRHVGDCPHQGRSSSARRCHTTVTAVGAAP